METNLHKLLETFALIGAPLVLFGILALIIKGVYWLFGVEYRIQWTAGEETELDFGRSKVPKELTSANFPYGSADPRADMLHGPFGGYDHHGVTKTH